jgi:GNAT superfamily N-acetyltransferase
MADVSVRPARLDDAGEVGRIQVGTWRWGYRDILPAEVLAELTEDTATEAWQEAIRTPPTQHHQVLIALEGDTAVGFAAFGPSDEREDGDPDEPTVAVASLLVEPRWQRRGHGSRLMAALADHVRDNGTARLVVWIPEADTATREFLLGAGWGPDGLARALDTGAGELREIRLHTRLDVV